jgi:RNA polymerase sigma factor (sigma-70 family)
MVQLVATRKGVRHLAKRRAISEAPDPGPGGNVENSQHVGHDTSFDRFYVEAYPTVYRAVFLTAGGRLAAEDAAQEAFARAYQRWGRLHDKPWTIGWVIRTALNTARRSHRTPAVVSFAAELGLTRDEPDWAEAIDLQAAIRRLPRRQREAMILRYVGDLPIRSMAQVMHCTEGTVKSHLARARVSIRDYLNGS